MSAPERFGIFSYEIIEDGEGMEGFDEVMYQTSVMLGLASAQPDRLPRLPEDD